MSPGIINGLNISRTRKLDRKVKSFVGNLHGTFMLKSNFIQLFEHTRDTFPRVAKLKRIFSSRRSSELGGAKRFMPLNGIL